MTIDEFVAHVRLNLSSSMTPDEFDDMLIDFFCAYTTNMSLERMKRWCKEFIKKTDTMNKDPNLIPAKGALCPKGGGHVWIEEYTNPDVQILRCSKCGKRSVGYLNPKFIFLLEGENA